MNNDSEGGKNMVLASRAESLLLCIKHCFLGLLQTTVCTRKHSKVEVDMYLAQGHRGQFAYCE